MPHFQDVKPWREHRSLSTIAAEIMADWKQPYFGAKPYLSAMYSLDKITDSYGADSAKSIVLYFLSNASSWRGDTARRIKAELKTIVKSASLPSGIKAIVLDKDTDPRDLYNHVADALGEPRMK